MTGPSPELIDLPTILAQERFMRGLAAELLHDPHDVDDAVQTGLWQVAKNPPRHASALRGFVRRVVTNLAHNLRREAHRRRAHERAAARPEGLADAAEMAAREEVRQRIGTAVLQLEEPYRSTVWLRYWQDLAPGAVARRMGVPRETVRTRLRRGLAQLRRQLDQSMGSRQAWTALLPVGTAIPTATFSTVLRCLAMNKLLIGAAAAILVSWLCWSALQLPVGRGLPAVEIAHGQPTPKAQAGGEVPALRAAVQVASADRQAGTVGTTGTLRQADGQPAVGLAYRLWGERRPYWAERDPKPLLVDTPPDLGDQLLHTDAEGGWRAPAGASSMTVQVDDALLVTFELATATPDLTLPPLATLEVEITGLEPDERWRLHNDAFVRGGGVVRSWAAGETTVTVAVLDRELELEGAQPQRLQVLAGWRHRLLAYGTGLEFAQWDQGATAPSRVRFEVVRRRPLLEVRVVATEGGPPLPIDGRLVYQRAASEAVSTAIVKRGRARLDTRYLHQQPSRFRLLLEDGELLERHVEPAEIAEGRLELVRGRGEVPLRVHLPADAGPTRSVVFVTVDGALRFGTDDQRDRVYVGLFPIWQPLPSGGVRIAAPPGDWATLHVLTRAGRAATVERTEGVREYWTAWLPDRGWSAPDLGAIHEAAGRPRRGTAELVVEVPSATGRPLHIALRQFGFDALTTKWPPWQIRLPVGWSASPRMRAVRPQGLDDDGGLGEPRVVDQGK